MAAPYNKHRVKIITPDQHPFKHDASGFAYTNPSVPVSTLSGALDMIFGVLYPNYQTAVANPAALPGAGNSLNDYRLVTDDGDGKSAGYRWEQREGDFAAQWYKVYDLDWGYDSVLSGFLTKTQDQYVARLGYDDIDDTGAFIAGLYAGQTIYGGSTANTNLTLRANSGDGTGASTGYVQVDDNFRPAVDATFSLGTASFKFITGYFSTSILASTMTLSTGSILDSSGAISFGDENLSTTGTMSTGALTSTGATIATTLVLATGSITDNSGAISFADENLSTTGTLGCGALTATGATIATTMLLATGSITDSSGSISFGNENLVTTGTLGAGATTVTSLQVDNLNLDGNTIISTDVNGNINITPNGTGITAITKALTTVGVTTTGTLGVTGQLNIDDLRLDGSVLSSTASDTDITLSPDGAGKVKVSKSLLPTSDNTLALGDSSNRFTTLSLSTSISDGTLAMAMATLMSFRDALSGVAPGNTLFYNGSKWLPSTPDSEIDHSTIGGLITTDAGHTQFVMLAGRASGQSIIGGTAANENLTLESTSNATKGDVFTKDDFLPFTNASYSGGWSGIDLGGTANSFRDLYSKGEFKGFRLENFTTAGLPSASAQNIGRGMWNTDTKKMLVDTGTVLTEVGVSKFLSDVAFDGLVTQKDVDVSATISDARKAIWALHDNSSDFARLYCSIKATSATNVRINTTGALPAASYRLIGIE